MGKWAKYQLRGSSGDGPALPSPPAPVLAIDGLRLKQTASGDPDPDGTIQIYEAPGESGPWTPSQTASWEAIKDWGNKAAYGGVSVKCLEIGNGKNYRGTSDWSNVLNIAI